MTEPNANSLVSLHVACVVTHDQGKAEVLYVREGPRLLGLPGVQTTDVDQAETLLSSLVFDLGFTTPVSLSYFGAVKVPKNVTYLGGVRELRGYWTEVNLEPGVTDLKVEHVWSEVERNQYLVSRPMERLLLQLRKKFKRP
jgi:hypothetical protein